eukprot:CAMPEP_0119349118 /NCGR_PEP_ID=MMETSP1333-20130426/109390_1 /TAXON_ID=418940 /ORGANISM="Scyphosphaera apsteinii, Strain RCC1455" /LENGTH=66 /DNA_ID=CAMNT_0007361713 /DNA_START=364 /DNA_END=564 /DNA_ORIENTATION=-
MACTIVPAELQPAGARVFIVATVHEHAFTTKHLYVKVLPCSLLAMLIAGPAAATRQTDAAATAAPD